MANTFELISSVTVGSPQATISFTSIPSTYTDLCLMVSARTTSNQSAVWASTFLTSNLGTPSERVLLGTGSAAASYNNANANIYSVSSLATANTFGNFQIYFPNYAGSAYKSASVESVGENNGTAALALINAVLWSSTSAINSITLTPTGEGNYAQYSTAYLYGVKNA